MGWSMGVGLFLGRPGKRVFFRNLDRTAELRTCIRPIGRE
jgi:hypothetical protein